MTKADKKKICSLLDVKKLTTDASMHAAQNERLPLRVVVQVLYFEQVRAASAAASATVAHHPNTTPCSVTTNTNTNEECCEKPANAAAVRENCKSLRNQVSRMKLNEEFRGNGKLAKKSSRSSRSGIQLLPSRSRRIFDKLWAVGKGHGENRSSETSASSQSPTSVVPGDTKSSGSSSRQRRHSIS